MRCKLCGMVVDGTEQPTAQETAKGMLACHGCTAAFRAAIAEGKSDEEAYAEAERVHHAAGLAEYYTKFPPRVGKSAATTAGEWKLELEG